MIQNDLMLLHGVGLNQHMWQEIQNSMPFIRTHCFDLRGHGQAKKWQEDEEASYEGFLDDLWDYADKRELDQFSLCGFSMGAMIAIKAAVEKPDRIQHLILLSGVYGRSAEQRKLVKERLALAKRNIRAVFDMAMKRWFPVIDEETKDIADSINMALQSNDPFQFIKNYQFFSDADSKILGLLSKIEQPTLIATGACDYSSTVLMAEHMAGKIKNVHLEIFADAGHLLPLQHAKKIGKLISNFLEIFSDGEKTKP